MLGLTIFFGFALSSFIKRLRQKPQQTSAPQTSVISVNPNQRAPTIDIESCIYHFNLAESGLSKFFDSKPKLETLVLHNCYDSRWEPQLTKLIRYALALLVQNLDLRLWGTYGIDAEIVLDEPFFNNTHFTHLKLSCELVFPTYRIHWQNLKFLALSEIRLDETFIQNILSGCPLLETFKLKECYGDILDLDITSTSVKDFVISGNKMFRNGRGTVWLNAPNISSLTIRGSLLLWQLLLEETTSLQEAFLDYADYDEGCFYGEEEEEILQRHMEALEHVSELTLGSRCQKVLSRLKAKGLL